MSIACSLHEWQHMDIAASTKGLGLILAAQGQWTQSSTQDVPDLAAAFDPLQHCKNRKRAQATSISLAGGGSDLEVIFIGSLRLLCSMQHIARNKDANERTCAQKYS
jgi:hypothetical protein